MSIDYREYFAGQCFGSMALSEETCNAELFGDDVDTELEEHLDEELFGATAKRMNRKDAFEKAVKNFKKNHVITKGKYGKYKMSLKFAEKNPTLLEKAKLDLRKAKNKMVRIRRRIVAMWKKLDDKFKSHWKAKNKMNINDLFKKYGPHQFQIKQGSSAVLDLDKIKAMSKEDRRSFIKGLSKQDKRKLFRKRRKLRLSKMTPEQRKRFLARMKKRRAMRKAMRKQNA